MLEHVDGEEFDRYCNSQAARRGRACPPVSGRPGPGGARARESRRAPGSQTVQRARHRGRTVKLLDFGIAKLLEPDGGTGQVTLLTREGGVRPDPGLRGARTGDGRSSDDGHRHLRARRAAVRAAHRAASGRRRHHVAGGASQSGGRNRPPAPFGSRARYANGSVEEVAAITASHAASPARLGQLLEGDLDIIVAKALKKRPVGTLRHGELLCRRPAPILESPADRRTGRLVRLSSASSCGETERQSRSPHSRWSRCWRPRGHAHAGPACHTPGDVAVAERQRADQQARDATEQRDFARRQLSRAEAINDLNAFLIVRCRAAGDVLHRARPARAGRAHRGPPARRCRGQPRRDAGRDRAAVWVGG